MPKLIPLKCPVCGANVSYDTLICGYCGTHFVLSEDKVAVQAKPRGISGQPTEVSTERTRVTEDDIAVARERFSITTWEGGSYEKRCQFELDDRVDRKIFRYCNETRERKYDTIREKLYEYELERDKLQHLLEAGRMDEDAYDDLRKELWGKYKLAKDRIVGMLDCGQAVMAVKDFTVKSVESKSNNFRDIKSIGRIVFSSVDGRVSGNTFIYKITGCVDCYLKSGLFSTKSERKYFSAEVDYGTGKVIQFSWEPNESLNVQEYRARPLPLPKFT